jgi:hypothetical protein
MRDETWRRIEAEIAEFPGVKQVAGPVTMEEVDAASVALGLPFPPDYREFLLRYGGGFVGPNPIFGVRQVESMGRGSTVLERNRWFKEQRWPGVEEWLIISEDGYGNPYGIAPDGQVWTSDHDFGDIVPIAKGFEDFIGRCMGLAPQSSSDQLLT